MNSVPRLSFWLLGPWLYFGCVVGAAGQTLRFEAETGTITTGTPAGTFISRSAAGYSGTGYVAGFPNQDSVVDRLSLNLNVPQGLYDLVIGYRSQFGEKGYELSVGAEAGSGMFPRSTTFAQHFAGQYYFEPTPTQVRISEGWGYYDIDYFELRPAAIRHPLPVAPSLINPAATANTRHLMQYLTTNYGAETLFGAQRENGNPNSILSSNYLNYTGGILPAILGGDLMRYSPSRVARGDNPNGESERLVNWAKQTGGIVSLMWHWNAPSGLIDQPGKEWWRGFYTDSTTFNLGAALANKNSAEYALLIRDIDVMAGELRKFQEANIPVLWRPLHEAQGGDSGAWFWWGASGAGPLKELWGIMHDRMTNHHGLDNLIWVSTNQVDASGWQQWYPGDDLVDIVGVDIYGAPGDNFTSQWLELLNEYDGRKLLALTETGTLTPEQALERYGVAFRYQSPWSESFLTTNHTPAQVQAIVGDSDSIDLNELPTFPWKLLAAPTTPGDYDRSGAVDVLDYELWRSQFGLTGSPAADGNADGLVDAADYTVWRDALGAAAVAAASTQPSVPEPGTRLLMGIAATVCCVAARSKGGGAR